MAKHFVKNLQMNLYRCVKGLYHIVNFTLRIDTQDGVSSSTFVFLHIAPCLTDIPLYSPPLFVLLVPSYLQQCDVHSGLHRKAELSSLVFIYRMVSSRIFSAGNNYRRLCPRLICSQRYMETGRFEESSRLSV